MKEQQLRALYSDACWKSSDLFWSPSVGVGYLLLHFNENEGGVPLCGNGKSMRFTPSRPERFRRCRKCCRMLGIPQGYGIPAYDQSLAMSIWKFAHVGEMRDLRAVKKHLDAIVDAIDKTEQKGRTA